MTTETKVEAVAWVELTASGRIAYFDGRPMLMVGPVGNEHHPVALYPQSALDALRGEVADRKARHERTERDACMWASRAESAEKRADAADRRAEECLKLADVLDLVSRSPDVTIPQWHRLAGIADEFRDALTKESP